MITGLGSSAWEVALFILVVGVLVTFHELGHFLAAKLVGVQVDVFSFGFGPRLFGFRLGPTDYRISLVPLGGYVRMRGDALDDNLEGAPHELESRRWWEKVFILVMGPTFNLVLAVALLAGVYMAGIEVPAWLGEPVVVESVGPGSPAESAGLRTGDRILAIDDRPVPDWRTFSEQVAVRPGATLRLTVQRAEERLVLPVTVGRTQTHGLGSVGAQPCFDVLVGAVTARTAAAEAGLRKGDELVSVDGRRPCGADTLVELVQRSAGAPMALEVLRAGERLSVSVAPRRDEEKKRWFLGILPAEAPGDMIIERHGPVGALRRSVKENVQTTRLLLVTIGRLFTGRLSMRSMSGPLELADITRETADLGLVPLLQLMALVSLNLWLFNLLPIPFLDGGRIAIVLVEAVRGRELSRRSKEWVLQVGVVMILALVAAVIYFDVIKKLER